MKGKRKEKNYQKPTCAHSGRRPSPTGTRLLFAGTISPMICPVDGPAEGRHEKTRRKIRQEEGRDGDSQKTKPAVLLCPVGGPRRTQQNKGRAETKG